MLKSPLDTTVDILLPVDLAEIRLGLWEKERIYTTVEMGVSRGGRVPSDHDDRAHGAVLGDKTSRISRGGENENSRSVEIQRGPDGRHGARLDNRDGPLDHSAHLFEMVDVGDGVLGLQAGLTHLTDGLIGVCTLGRLTGKLY